ncbi:uncharacterized protein [Rutidosis leptorrhynchoides]|uniref:uncharacterized protein n=1 Tax=Rutidosis leptorrhynchoides TaxID=125765 RepID=UPI003A9A2124
MDNNRQFVINNNQVEGDFIDDSPPGCRFRPTDSELIIYYLKPKIETGTKHPGFRLYEVNLYNYTPDHLSSTSQFRDYDGTWYFLTPLVRKYPNGKRPERRIKGENGGHVGYWKASQACTTVYDDADRRKVVGNKRNFTYYNKQNKKTEWQMYEYTIDDTNLPIGNKLLTPWVLCKIYKFKRNSENNQQEHVSNTSYQADENIVQNQPLQAPKPSRRRRRVSSVAQSSNDVSSSTLVEPLPIAAAPPQPLTTDHNNVTSIARVSIIVKSFLILHIVDLTYGYKGVVDLGLEVRIHVQQGVVGLGLEVRIQVQTKIDRLVLFLCSFSFKVN